MGRKANGGVNAVLNAVVYVTAFIGYGYGYGYGGVSLGSHQTAITEPASQHP